MTAHTTSSTSTLINTPPHRRPDPDALVDRRTPRTLDRRDRPRRRR